MDNLVKCLKENRPTISESTIRTYTSILGSLYKKNNDSISEAKREIDCKWFDNQEHIIKLLDDKAPSTRKTTFAALIALVKDNEKYRKAMLSDCKVYQNFIQTQKKTITQSDNWKSQDEVKEIYDSYFKKVKPLLSTKEKLDAKDFKNLQDFIVLSLTCGIYFPPRRSMDWCELKIKNIDKKNENYLEGNKFIFNKFKTAKFYQQQSVEIPNDFLKILKRYIKLNPHDYLLNDINGNKMTNVKLSQKLNRIFGNKISTSMLRHIYLTDKLKDAPSLQDLNTLSKNMGNSPLQALEYVKH